MKQLYRITSFLLISFLIFHRNFVLSEKYESPYVNIFSLGFEQYLKNFHLFYNKTLTEMTRILSTPQIPERYWDGLVHPPDGMLNKDKILGFSWANCGSPDDPVQVKSLSISPDPIRVPGVLTVGFDILTLLNITSPQVDLVLQKKVLFFWIKVPCLNGFGSCSYTDACTLIPKPCPEEIKKRKLPCDCPVTKGEYMLPPSSLDLPPFPTPSWLTQGDYKIKATGTQGGGRLFCLNIALSFD